MKCPFCQNTESKVLDIISSISCPVYAPVEDGSMVVYSRYEDGMTLRLDKIATDKTPKDILFPQWENLMHFRLEGKNIELTEEDDTGDVVNDAIFRRNAKVQEQFGIELEFTGTPGSNPKMAEYVNVCVNNTQSGADACDIFAGYSMTGATLTTEGVTQNLAEYEYMEFDKPWWPKSLVDTVTIMRDGNYITTLDVKNTCKDELVTHMVGRDVVYQYGAGTSQIGDELLRLENLSYKKEVKGVNLTLHRGEVLGLAGLEGAGRTELMELIYGVKRPESGKMYLSGKEIVIHSPGDAKAHGIAYLTKDRKSQGLFLRKTITENVLAANLDRFSKKGIVQPKGARKDAEEYKEKFEIKTPDVDKLVSQLSGGNQQKVLLSMWISRNPQLLLIDEPTRGIDVGTKETIHRLIRQFAKEGMGVIIVSSDMPELMGASDRIVAMYEGEISGELSLNEITEQRIMALTSGMKI